MRFGRVALPAALVLTVASALASAQQPQPAPPGSALPAVLTQAPEIGQYGGALVTSQIGEPRTFNPIVAAEDSSTNLLAPIFEGLVEQNILTGEIEPALAESWTVSPDGRMQTFTLREGVQWSDGQPFTVDDVAFTLGAIFTDGVQSPFIDLLTIDGKPVRYRALDDRRIRFTTDKPAGLLLRVLTSVKIVPRHRLASVLARGGAEMNKAWGITTPPQEIIGTGPFVLQSYAPGGRAIYLRNARYWRADAKGNRLPYLTRYEVMIVPTRDDKRQKFVAGESDLYDARPQEYADLTQQQTAGNYTIHDGPETLSALFLMFNQNPAGLMAPKLTWFQDVQFRRALNYAIDRNAIVERVYAGRATPAWGPVSPVNTLYWHRDLPSSRYDLGRAQEMLAAAGYRKGGDALLRDAQGTAVTFVLSTISGNAEHDAIATILRQDFARLGIQVTVTPAGFNTFVGQLLGTYQWEAVIAQLLGKIEPGVDAQDVWLSSGPLHLWSPKQERPATSWEAETDQLFDQIGHEVREAQRAALYRRWQEIVATQLPQMYFAYPKTQPAVRNTVGNVQLGLGEAVGSLSTLYRKGSYRP
jgi:peptide/nickel transport system substrate-binding protein